MRASGGTAFTAAGPSPKLREGQGAGTPLPGGAPAPAGLASGGPLHLDALFWPPPLPIGPLHGWERAQPANHPPSGIPEFIPAVRQFTGTLQDTPMEHPLPHGSAAPGQEHLVGFGRIGSAAGHPVCRREAVPSHASRPPWPWTKFVSGHPMTVCSGPPAVTAMRNSTHDPWRMRRRCLTCLHRTRQSHEPGVLNPGVLNQGVVIPAIVIPVALGVSIGGSPGPTGISQPADRADWKSRLAGSVSACRPAAGARAPCQQHPALMISRPPAGSTIPVRSTRAVMGAPGLKGREWPRG